MDGEWQSQRAKSMEAGMESLYNFGLETTRWLQTTYPQLADFFRILSELGIEEFYLVLLPLIYWCVHKRLGKHLAYVFLLTNLVASSWKHLLREPRPFWLDSSVGLAMEESYGIPSTHVQPAATTYFFLAAWVRRRWAWLLATLIVVLMALSRIYLGVHFVHDTIAGFLIAVIMLALYFIWRRYFAGQFEKRILGYRLLAALLLPVLIVAVYAAVYWLLGEPDTAVSWGAFIPDAELAGLEGVATAFGALLGAGIGLTLEGSRVRFLVQGPLWQRALRYLVGIIVTVAIWAGLRLVFPSEPLWLALPLRVLRYSLILLWVSYHGPMVFVWLRLARAEPAPRIEMSL
jgi:membrane-associated phospholipid phosphatase